MADEPLHYLGLLEVGRKILSGEVTSAEVTRSQLDRIAAVDRQLNSYIEVTADLAMAQARAADEEIGSGGSRGSLHGVPVALKDVCDLAGYATTAGMFIHRSRIASRDASVVRRLKDAGAVILGKTNLTEGVYAEHAAPFGAPVNPWGADRYPGASSSGSGVAVAAGLCYGAISSDTGGSIRLPSAANGVTGLKPTWGRVSRSGIFELAATLDHVGPMARSAADAGAILAAIAGADADDPTALLEDARPQAPWTDGILRSVRVGLDAAWTSEKVDEVTVATLHAFLEVLKGLGAEIVQVSFPDPTQIVEDWFDVCGVQTALAHEQTFQAHRASYGPALTSLIERGNALSGIDLQRVLARRETFKGRVQALFRTMDVLAIPVMAFETPTVDRMKAMDDDMISGLHRYTCSFTMSGNPTITMPGGFSVNGMPIAVQLVGPHHSEFLLVEIGAAFQARTDWHRRRPVLAETAPAGLEGARGAKSA